MKWIRLGFLFVLFAPYIAAQTTPAVSPADTACGPSATRFQVKKNQGQPQVPALEAGSARIYVIEDLLTGEWSDPLVRIGIDGVWVDADQGNSWSTFTVPAGEHHLCADWQPGPIHSGGRALYGFKADADSTYYLRVRFPAVANGHTNDYGVLFEPVNPDEAQYLLSQYPQATSAAKK
jgi:hypothetical protein